MKISRNDPCPCGSGKKYKKCCLQNMGTNANKAPSSEFMWHKIRKTENDLVSLLLDYAKERFGDEIFPAAWDEFLLYRDIEIDENILMDMDPMFSLWFVFIWEVSEFMDDDALDAMDLPEITIAMLYIKEHPDQLDAYENQYIQTACQQPYSFYQVIDSDYGNSLTIKDLLLNRTHIVLEKQASRQEIKGAVLFTRVISMEGISVMIGCFTLLIPTIYHSSLISLRQNLKKENGELTAMSLLDLDFELREVFFEIYENVQNPVLPELQNTDGDPLVPIKLFYDINCTPAKAVDCLKELADGLDDEELFLDAEFDDTGTLEKIRFPWLKKGNPKHPEWENTVMGHIDINQNSLTIEVNSEIRSELIQIEIKYRLQDNAVYKNSVMTSIKKTMEEMTGNGPSPEAEAQARTHEELMQIPEIRQQINQMAEKHWNDWLDIKVPALGGMTPREAANDPIGREKLDGLFLHFESMNRQQPQNDFSPDIPKLKQILGIEKE